MHNLINVSGSFARMWRTKFFYSTILFRLTLFLTRLLTVELLNKWWRAFVMFHLHEVVLIVANCPDHMLLLKMSRCVHALVKSPNESLALSFMNCSNLQMQIHLAKWLYRLHRATNWKPQILIPVDNVLFVLWCIQSSTVLDHGTII